MKEYMSEIYQFAVLVSIVTIILIQFIYTKDMNEILLGALVAVCAGIGIQEKRKQ